MLNNKIALITGATSGIGLALARVFAEHKYNLVIVARKAEGLTATADDLRAQYNIEVNYFAVDLSEADAPRKIFDFCQSQNLNIDVLVNNAGFAVYGAFMDVPVERNLNIAELNMLAPLRFIALFLPGLIKLRGKILNVASTAAFQPGPFMSVYYASKTFILSFSEALRSELKDQGAGVTCLCPGPTMTNFQKLAGSDFRNTKLIKFGLMMSAEKVAKAGFSGLMKNRSVVIPGLLNKLLAFWAQVLPRQFIIQISRWTLKKK